MNFKEYWKSKDPDNYTGMSCVTARAAWIAAMNACPALIRMVPARWLKRKASLVF